MDIDLLSKMIGELILDHDELSLPGLGTFVAEEVPATFSDRGYTVNPPYRKLSFYQRPESDHLLIDFYASSNGVSFNDASLIIVRFLDEMKSILKEKKVIVLPGLGRLRATRENNFFFVPDADLDIYPDGFGLRPVSMKNHTESQAELSGAVSKLSGMLFSESAEKPVSEPVVPVDEPSAASNVEAPAAVVEPVETTEQENDNMQGHFDKLNDRNENEDSEVVSTGSTTARKGLAAGLKILIGVVGLAVLALGVFLLLAHVAPELIDSLLYTPEELEILNYPLQ
jgi:hypothetical protein